MIFDAEMKICIISEYFPPDQVGASRRTKILAETLSEEHQVTVLAASPHYPKSKSEIKWYKPVQIRYNKGYREFRFWMPELDMTNSFGRILNYLIFSFLASFYSIFIKSQDLVWGTSPNVFVSIPINFHKILYKSKRIINVDDLWPTAPIELGFLENEFLRKIALKFAIISLHQVDGISTISDKLEEILKDITIRKIPIKTVYVGIEEKRLEELCNNKSVNKNKSFLFMYSGKLGPAYDFKLLINTFNSWFNEGNYNAELLIRGTGPQQNRIQKLINISKNKNIKLDTKYLSDPEYDKLLSSADCFVLPMKDNFISKTAIPTKLLEYIASGKPSLIISKGEPMRITQEAKAGVVSTFDLESIKDNIMNVYQGNRVNDRSNQINYIKSNFTKHNILNQANSLIYEVFNIE